MKLSEKLLALSSWLASEDNELLKDADENTEALRAVATALTIASDALNETAEYVAAREPEEAQFSPEKLDEIAATAAELDANGLAKQAAVLDDILLTIGAPKGFKFNFKKAEEDRISELKKKYQGNSDKSHEQNKIADDEKTLKDSGVLNKAVIRDQPLSTRTCVEHPGVSLSRVGENEYQCSMDKRIFSYEQGYTTLSGKHVPGSSISLQTQMMGDQIRNEHAMFSTRKDILGSE